MEEGASWNNYLWEQMGGECRSEQMGGKVYPKERIFRKEGMLGVLKRRANFQIKREISQFEKANLKDQWYTERLKSFLNESKGKMIHKTPEYLVRTEGRKTYLQSVG